MNRKIELLAPAGDPYKLKIALKYGADAVYAGGEAFGLRSAAGNFTADEMRTASAPIAEISPKYFSMAGRSALCGIILAVT